MIQGLVFSVLLLSAQSGSGGVVVDSSSTVGTVRIYSVDGEIHTSSSCPGRAELVLPDAGSRPLVLVFEGDGLLPQAKIVNESELAETLDWSPRIEYGGVFLYEAEGRVARSRSTKWPVSTYSISRQIGKPIGDFLGINNQGPFLDGFYLTGEVRASTQLKGWKGVTAWTSVVSPTLSRPLAYNLSITPFGSNIYPVHRFPIPMEKGLNRFEFELESEGHPRGLTPRMLGLQVRSLASGEVETVVAIRDSGSSTYSFYARDKEVEVVGSIFGTWDTLGLSGGEYSLTRLISGTGVQAQLTELGNVYVQVPESWGISAIPGMKYSVRGNSSNEDSVQERFFVEGGGAFLPPGSYTLLLADSQGDLVSHDTSALELTLSRN